MDCWESVEFATVTNQFSNRSENNLNLEHLPANPVKEKTTETCCQLPSSLVIANPTPTKGQSG